VWIATGGGVGNVPLAPGTVGSLIGAACSFPALGLDWPLYVALLCGLCLLAVFVTGRAAQTLGHPDPPVIILDEFVGMWCAVLLLTPSWYDLTAVFILFRIFDIVKPSPLPRLERLPGGLGIVLDDVAAGLLARGTWWLLQANFDFL
jgi:phosphatidylglycerophosphatase A